MPGKKHCNCPKKLQLQLLFKHDGKTGRKYVYCNSLKFNNRFLILRSNYGFLLFQNFGEQFHHNTENKHQVFGLPKVQVRLGFAFSTSSVGAKPHRAAQKKPKKQF